MLVPINFTYTTSCMLSIITFAIRFAISRLLLVFHWIHWNWASISSRFWDIGGHDLDLSWPLDIIGHIGHSIRRRPFPVDGLLNVDAKSLSLTASEIFCLKPHVLTDTMLNRHCACAMSRDMYQI